MNTSSASVNFDAFNRAMSWREGPLRRTQRLEMKVKFGLALVMQSASPGRRLGAGSGLRSAGLISCKLPFGLSAAIGPSEPYPDIAQREITAFAARTVSAPATLPPKDADGVSNENCVIALTPAAKGPPQ